MHSSSSADFQTGATAATAAVSRVDLLAGAVHPFFLTFNDPVMEADYAKFQYEDSGFIGGKLWHGLAVLINSMLMFIFHTIEVGWDTKKSPFGPMWLPLFISTCITAVIGVMLFFPVFNKYREIMFLVSLATHWPTIVVQSFFGMGDWIFAPVFVLGCMFFCTFVVQGRFVRVFWFIGVVPPLVLVITTLAIGDMQYWRSNQHTPLEAAFWVMYFAPVLLLRGFERQSRRNYVGMRIDLDRIEDIKLRTAAARDMILVFFAPTPVHDFLSSGNRIVRSRVYPATAMVVTDVVDFTSWSSQVDSNVFVASVSTMFSNFDSFADKHGVEKIATVGDAYMGAIFPQLLNADHESEEAIRSRACQMLRFASDVQGKQHVGDFRLRVGCHIGTVLAGFAGSAPPTFDLFGDAVMLTKEMEQTGAAGRLHVTGDMMDAVAACKMPTPTSTRSLSLALSDTTKDLRDHNPDQLHSAYGRATMLSHWNCDHVHHVPSPRDAQRQRQSASISSMSSWPDQWLENEQERARVCRGLISLGTRVPNRTAVATPIGSQDATEIELFVSSAASSPSSSCASSQHADLNPLSMSPDPAGARGAKSRPKGDSSTTEATGEEVGGGQLIHIIPPALTQEGASASTSSRPPGRQESSMISFSEVYTEMQILVEDNNNEDSSDPGGSFFGFNRLLLRFKNKTMEKEFSGFLRGTHILKLAEFTMLLIASYGLLVHVLLDCIDTTSNRLLTAAMGVILLVNWGLLRAGIQFRYHWVYHIGSFLALAALSIFWTAGCTESSRYHTGVMITFYLNLPFIVLQFRLDVPFLRRLVINLLLIPVIMGLTALQKLAYGADAIIDYDLFFLMAFFGYSFYSYFADFSVRTAFASEQRLEEILNVSRNRHQQLVTEALDVMIPSFVANDLLSDAASQMGPGPREGDRNALPLFDAHLLVRATRRWEFKDLCAMFILLDSDQHFTTSGDAELRSTGAKVFDELHRIFCSIEDVLAAGGCHKIKTIGNTMLIVSGIPPRSNSPARSPSPSRPLASTPQSSAKGEAKSTNVVPQHVLQTLDTVGQLHRQVLEPLRHRGWTFRCGVHIGPALGAVFGTQSLMFDVFGDTINTASRLTTYTDPNTIRVSQPLYELDPQLPTRLPVPYRYVANPPIHMKGKGEISTYRLEMTALFAALPVM